MFKVKDRKSGEIFTVYQTDRTVMQGMDFNSFLIFKNNAWVWVNASKYVPVEE